MKIIRATSLFFVCFSLFVSGKVKVEMLGVVAEGLYEAKLESIDRGKVGFSLGEGVDIEGGIRWSAVSDVPFGKYVLLIYDHHPSISRSCILAKVVEVTKKDQLLVVQFLKKPTLLTLKTAKTSQVPLYFPKNSKIVVSRLRKIDQLGRVDRWVFFQKTGKDGEYEAICSNVEAGGYLIDLLEKSKNLRVAGGNEELGYAVWTRKIEIKKDQNRVVLEM